MPNRASENIFDCIVLGAGITGVTAARNLQQEGLRVLILEGSDRIGGRIYSKRNLVLNPDYVPDSANPGGKGKFIPVEAGAEYVHIEDNRRYKEFWDEIKKHAFTTSKYPKTSIFHKTDESARNRIFFRDWKRVLTTDEALKEDDEIRSSAGMLFMLELKDLFNQTEELDLSAKVFANSQEKYIGRGMTMAEYTLSAHTPGLLDNPPPGLPSGKPNPNDTISVAGILSDEIQDQMMGPAEFRLELEQEGENKICGYDTLPKLICQQFLNSGGALKKSEDNDTNMKVVRVERTDEGIITVTTKGGKKFSARSAICTFSVGMLHPETGEGKAIFGNLLTDKKMAALDVVKMGPITKFSLEFKERLWGPDAAGMTILSNPEGKARTFFSSFPDRFNGPNVLTGLLMGKDHLAIKNLNDEDAIQHLLDELKVIFDMDGTRWMAESVLVGNRDEQGKFVPNYHRQDWEKDGFAKGGNSFLKFNPPEEGKMEVTEARETLKNPRETLPLFWAGEATAPAYHRKYQPLAVHGAYISGAMAAEDINHYLKVCNSDKKCFDKYYRKRYIRRGLLERLTDFFKDLFS